MTTLANSPHLGAVKGDKTPFIKSIGSTGRQSEECRFHEETSWGRVNRNVE